MKRKVLLSVLVIFLTVYSSNLKGQNLVPNWSFEDTVSCPTQPSHPEISIGWSNYRGSADYFNICADSSSLVSAPQNGWGYQYPHTGNACMGIQCYFTSEYREFFGCKLLSPLIIGQKYFISFYVNCGFGGYFGASGGSNKTGVLLSTIQYSFSSPAPIHNFAHVYADSIITDTLNWVRIEGSLIADSNYDYIIIGNFFDDTHTDTTHLVANSSFLRAYYFVDDVCVTTDSVKGCNILEAIKNNSIKEEALIYPNPVAKYLSIKNHDEGQTSISIYNCLGKLMYSRLYLSKESVINMEDIPSGLYIIEIKSELKTLIEKISVVH